MKVTDQRTCGDFAECMRDPVDVHYPTAKRIRVVLDNLSSHSAAALYKTFEPQEARRILSRIEFHFVPKHASWLNMVEIEIGVLKSQCLARRIEARRRSVARSTPGSADATPTAPGSSGSSPSRRRGSRCDARIPRSPP